MKWALVDGYCPVVVAVGAGAADAVAVVVIVRTNQTAVWADCTEAEFVASLVAVVRAWWAHTVDSTTVSSRPILAWTLYSCRPGRAESFPNSVASAPKRLAGVFHKTVIECRLSNFPYRPSFKNKTNKKYLLFRQILTINTRSCI